VARRRGPAEVTVKPRRRTPFIYRLDNHRWRVLKAKHKAHSRSRNLPCARCHNAIDYSLPPQHRLAYETGHVISRKDRPDLMYVWANLQAEHVKCNRSAQSNRVVAQHDWVRPSW
jgi:hypothetical protein